MSPEEGSRYSSTTFFLLVPSMGVPTVKPVSTATISQVKEQSPTQTSEQWAVHTRQKSVGRAGRPQTYGFMRMGSIKLIDEDRSGLQFGSR